MTEEEFNNLKVGDYVRLKPGTTTSNDPDFSVDFVYKVLKKDGKHVLHETKSQKLDGYTYIFYDVVKNHKPISEETKDRLISIINNI